MATIDVFNLKREKVGTLNLADEIFGTEVNEALFYDVVKAQLASRRQGTSSAKERSAVSGSTKKLYKQKGTGSARHGSKRAPTFVGGGIAHGPRPRDWSYRPPAKMRAGALTSALSMFLKEGRLVIVDRLELKEFKTKSLVGALDTLGVTKPRASGKASKALVVDTASNEKLRISIRNCKEHAFLPPEGVNVYDLLRHDHLVLSQDAAKALEQRLLAKAARKSDAKAADKKTGAAK